MITKKGTFAGESLVSLVFSEGSASWGAKKPLGITGNYAFSQAKTLCIQYVFCIMPRKVGSNGVEMLCITVFSEEIY